ncbi:MAG: hypothetical protein UY63_C0021G0005 [Parcubacteria group bacterium GW2011_GWA2_51_10]|nr:MAG: hypothetical protein UY63_C0021G0005 [Parcubacteria group bacterium GW2011_GWA2_51_10]
MRYNGKDSGTAGTGVPVATGQQVTVGAGNVNITVVSDATTISKIYGPSQTGLQLGKWKFAAANDDVTLNKLTLETVRQAGVGGGVQDALGTFGTLSLYDGATKLADASYVAGDVVFTGFSSSISMDSYKVYTLKGNSNGSGVISNNTTTAFVVKSDSNTDMEARSAAGALLGTADINFNSASNAGAAESRLATSTAYIFHDAYPTVAAVSLGSSLALDTKAQILKFTLTNSGTRDLRFGSTTISISVSGLQSSGVVTAASGTIHDFRLYEDNGAGALGTWIAGGASGSADVAIGTTTANPATISFQSGNDQGALLTNFVVSPGATRTLIVTADTSNMGSAKTAGTSVTLSAKISGTTGWSGTAWNTGNLFYFYTPVGGSENAAPGFTASDSYDVQGSTMSRSF